MQLISSTVGQHLVLIGGGHSHAIALRQFGLQPLSGLRITLISEAVDTPYSGMLPGHVAGIYRRDECHIDLRSLCRFAQVEFVVDRAVGLDLSQNQVICQRHPAIAFDWLSIDAGSTPKVPEHVLGVHSVAAKPIPAFLDWWERVCERAATGAVPDLAIAIVGGGAGGVELALMMQQRLRTLGPRLEPRLHLFQRDRTLMPRHSPWVQRYFRQLLQRRGIALHLGETVETIHAGKLQCQSGLSLQVDETVWVTQASAPDWIGTSGLGLDRNGFILVDGYLRSLSHPQVFAAGDIASIQGHPRPKAGVFAVRQGKPLFRNLRRSIRGQPLQPYRPQNRYLSLIGTGDGSAVASYGPWGLHGPWFWTLKDRIDRGFMQQFVP